MSFRLQLHHTKLTQSKSLGDYSRARRPHRRNTLLAETSKYSIYAGPLALALITNKLDEHGLLRDAELHEINEDTIIRFRKTSVSFSERPIVSQMH